MPSAPKPKSRRIVLFDGVCNFCDQAVLFIIDRDQRGQFEFAALQSPVGRELCERHHIVTGLSTMVLIEDEQVYTQSTAALRIARRLDGLWPLAYMLIVVPKFLRDRAYSFFAKNRYRWFGELDACRVPTPELRSRFLDMPAASTLN